MENLIQFVFEVVVLERGLARDFGLRQTELLEEPVREGACGVFAAVVVGDALVIPGTLRVTHRDYDY